jgi:hypothetical protein
MSAFRDANDFAFVRALEAAFPTILVELQQLGPDDWVESPDSLTTVDGVYDETGWRSFALFGAGDHAMHRARCPATAAACAAVPGLVNAGFSLFRPGTHLHPHHGEVTGVLRCHLPLDVPDGDVGIRFGTETRRWQRGRCLVVLIVTFSAAASRSA